METPGRSYSSMHRWEAEAWKTPDVDIDQSVSCYFDIDQSVSCYFDIDQSVSGNFDMDKSVSGYFDIDKSVEEEEYRDQSV